MGKSKIKVAKWKTKVEDLPNKFYVPTKCGKTLLDSRGRVRSYVSKENLERYCPQDYDGIIVYTKSVD